MSNVTKMQLLEKIRQLPRKSRLNFLQIAQVICSDVTNKFAVERNPNRFYNQYGHGIYWFDIPAAVLGKWRREGLVHKAGTCYNQALYELSELLKDFSIFDYRKYVNNHDFYKLNLGIIETVFEEQEISKEEQDFWVSHFHQPVAKHHFIKNKEKERKARQEFDIGDYVSFHTANKKAYQSVLYGEIVKLNPVRAVIKIDIQMSSRTELWMCPYSRLIPLIKERLVA